LLRYQAIRLAQLLTVDYLARQHKDNQQRRDKLYHLALFSEF